MFKKIFIVYLSLLSGYVFANDEDNKIVKIAITDSPPFEFQEGNKIVGLDVEAARESFAVSGYEVKFVMVPWLRAVMLAETGRVDAVLSIKETQERKEKLLFSDSLGYTKSVFFKLSSLNIAPTNLNQLKKYTIGILADYPYGKKFNDIKFPKLSVMISDNAQLRNLKKLKAGRVDLVACEINLCNYLINKYPDELSGIDYIKTVDIEEIHPYYIAFSKSNMARSQELLQKFNEGLKKYIAEGKRATNIERYDLRN